MAVSGYKARTLLLCPFCEVPCGSGWPLSEGFRARQMISLRPTSLFLQSQSVKQYLKFPALRHNISILWSVFDRFFFCNGRKANINWKLTLIKLPCQFLSQSMIYALFPYYKVLINMEIYGLNYFNRRVILTCLYSVQWLICLCSQNLCFI